MLDTDIESHDCATTQVAASCTRAEAEAAVRTLLRWAGDDPDREGLRETPARVARAYREWFSGYRESPAGILARSFDGTEGYEDLVVVRNIPVVSTCEHHLAAIRGVAHVAYLAGPRVVGLSKLSRAVEVFARRLQVQERLTAQIAQAITQHCAPRGAAVAIIATHDCMTSRGARSHGSETVTRHFTAECRTQPWRSEAHALLSG